MTVKLTILSARSAICVYKMTGAFKFLLCLSLLLAAAHGNILNANDFQSCLDLCTSCDGRASFENGICKCSVREDDTKGLECVMRLKREVEDLGLESASDDAETAERSARCSLLGSRRRIASGDADRVASYFMNGGPITGTPLLGSPNSACATSGDPITGAINPSNAKPRPAEPEVEKKIDPAASQSPVVAAPNHACTPPQYQPIVSSSWMPSHDTGYAPIIGAPQPYQTGFYPHMLGAVPHMVMAIPNAVMRAASQIPSHHPGMLGASHHSPILASLASGTHGVLQRLDKMVSPYASDNHNKMVGAPLHQTSDCPRSSHPSYPNSNMVGAPAAQTPDSSQINTSMLQQVLAHQNSLLEALSHQLESLSPKVGAPRMQYAPIAPSHYMLGAPHAMSHYAPQPMGQYVQQPMSHYCPDGSSMVGSPKAAESPEKSAEAPPKEAEKVAAPKDAEDKVGSPAEKETEKDADADKKTEETKKTEEEESQKTKRETRSRSTNRKKRGDVKYAKKRETQSFLD